MNQTDTPENQFDFKKAEFRESTITEYRKGQIVRLVDVFVIAPICVYAGWRYRKEMPVWLSVSLVVIGASTFYYNAKNFLTNWKQDGVLIREAIKVRNEKKRGKPNNEDVKEEKKEEKKGEVKVEKKENNNGQEKKTEVKEEKK